MTCSNLLSAEELNLTLFTLIAFNFFGKENNTEAKTSPLAGFYSTLNLLH